MSELVQNPKLNISTGTIIRFFIVLLLIVAAYYLSDVVLVILAAVVIASAIEPVVRRLKSYRIHRIIGAVAVYILLASLLAGIIVFFMPMVINDISGFLSSAPKTITLGDLWAPISDWGSGTLATKTISVSDFVNSMRSFFTGTDTGAGAFHTATIIFGGFLSFVLTIVLSFYLSVQEDGVGEFLRIVTPVSKHKYITDLWRRSQRKIAYWLQGQVILGIIVGLLVYLVLIIMNIPHALALALFAAIFEIIPVFGPIISSIPAILVAFTDVGLGTGFLLMGLYIVIYQIESQIFYPLVVKKVVGVSPIVVILALVIGFRLAGILGALVSVPLAAAIMEYVNDIQRRKKDELEASEKPVA